MSLRLAARHKERQAQKEGGGGGGGKRKVKNREQSWIKMKSITEAGLQGRIWVDRRGGEERDIKINPH